jgi:hypothetical protein
MKNVRDVELSPRSRRDLRSVEKLTHPLVIIPHRRFGKTYRYYLQGSVNQEDGADRSSRNIDVEFPVFGA